jgi:alkylation response protein AidB-like acyl-CoA dehydrogenase
MTGLLTSARDLARELPSHRRVHDTERQLAAPVVAALRTHGILGALVPRELGGAELTPVEYLELLETLAAGDSATAWCVMTASTSTLLAAYVARPTADALWGTGGQTPFIAGVFAPGGKLTPDGDGQFRLSGKWSWASGSRHAEWFAVGAITERRHMVCFVPASAVRIVENWDTLGLGGTGSHDIVIEDAVITASHVTSVFDRAPWATSALYRVPLFGLLATGIAGCALGVAKSALGHVGSKLTAEAGSAVLASYAEARAELAGATTPREVSSDSRRASPRTVRRPWCVRRSTSAAAPVFALAARLAMRCVTSRRCSRTGWSPRRSGRPPRAPCSASVRRLTCDHPRARSASTCAGCAATSTSAYAFTMRPSGPIRYEIRSG